MDSHKISVKFFLTEGQRFNQSEVVKVFHSWIQEAAAPEHLLIDVADYQHVHSGPGIVLVAHEANILTDESENHPGLLYTRKQPVSGANDFSTRLRACLRYTMEACARLESEPTLGQLRFRADEAIIRIHDRLLAPSTPETFAAVKDDIERVLKEFFPGGASLQHRNDPQRLFEVSARISRASTLTAALETIAAHSIP